MGGLTCEYCERYFLCRHYGGYDEAKNACDNHRASHRGELLCLRCADPFPVQFELYGKEAMARARKLRDTHQASCNGFECHHCDVCFYSGSDGDWEVAQAALAKHEWQHWRKGTYKDAGSPKPGDEHGILLGATKVDEFCLVAWHCEAKTLFRIIPPDARNKFWSEKDFEDLKITDGCGFRFRRHPNQDFRADWELPHENDNIRVFDLSPIPFASYTIQPSSQPVEDLLGVDPKTRCAEIYTLTESSFALVHVSQLRFHIDRECRVPLRCDFRNGGRWYRNVVVVNHALGQRSEVPTPEGEQLVVLGLGCRGYKLMLDAWLPQYR